MLLTFLLSPLKTTPLLKNEVKAGRIIHDIKPDIDPVWPSAMIGSDSGLVFFCVCFFFCFCVAENVSYLQFCTRKSHNHQ